MPVLPTPDRLDSAEAQPNDRCVHGICRTGLDPVVLTCLLARRDPQASHCQPTSDAGTLTPEPSSSWFAPAPPRRPSSRDLGNCAAVDLGASSSHHRRDWPRAHARNDRRPYLCSRDVRHVAVREVGPAAFEARSGA